ncbi:MAG: histidinol dehydrogenase [Spirochaetia bacterium]|jgi:histidinol dehydrogenase|nr:histidinol dehydrogenase [Spirochaetia bacterium]
MMLDFTYDPKGDALQRLLSRSMADDQAVKETVCKVLAKVKTEGDTALFDFARQFDHVELSALRVTQEEIAEAKRLVDPRLKKAICQAADNITAFHKAELPQAEYLEPMEGIELSRKIVPISSVGLYVPGGTAPLFSTVLMLSLPAKVAGCRSVTLCTPPGKDGTIHPALLFAADLGGVTNIYKCGGAQAIAAMAYGTQTIAPVEKIFGPGNRFVTTAKMLVSETVAIDMPAGPSEVMVIADPTSDPAFVASDFLSQAEHGKDSQSMLVVIGDEKEATAYMQKIERALEKQLSQLPRHEYLLPSLAHSHALAVPSLERCAQVVNAYAPEHLVINLSEPEKLADLVENAGSIFLGPWSCESAGDYASGTNHTLPTRGWARSYSGVSTDSFLKKITIQKLSKAGLEHLSDTIVTMAEGEMLSAHANAVQVRLGKEKK